MTTVNQKQYIEREIQAFDDSEHQKDGVTKGIISIYFYITVLNIFN